MDEVKQTKIVKKSLKVAVNEVPKEEPLETANELIEAPKIQKLTKKGKPDTRGKSTTSTDNLAKGRAKLEEVWAEKRKLKEQYEAQALERKVAKELKLKKIINKQYGVESEDEAEQEEEVVVQPVAKKVSVKQPAPVKEVLVKQPREKVVIPKKKVVKYVEVESEEEEEEEEEEIVYVKKQKQVVQKQVVQRQAPSQPQQRQSTYIPPIQFF